jgi:hypothetical protein
MSKLMTLFLVAMMAAIFSGCGFIGDDGRMDAWKETRKEEEKTKQEILKTKQAEFAAGKGETEKNKRNPTVQITTYGPDGKTPISTTTVDVAPSIAAATGHSVDGDDNNTYGIKVKETPMPKGAVSEGLEATGNAVTKVANAPAVVVGATGAAVVGALKETGGGQKIEVHDGDFNATDSFNKQEQIAIGTNLQPQQQAAQDPVDPVIVEPSYPPQ